MSKYRKVDPRIWNDEKFRALGDREKLVFFFLLTHPHMTALGAMRATLPGLAAELGWDFLAFREAFQQVMAKGMAKHDEKASLIWLPRFIKYNQPESPNVVKAWIGALDLLPECDLLTRVIACSSEFARTMNKGFAEALPEAFAKTMPIQEQEQEQEQLTPEANASPDLATQVAPDPPADESPPNKLPPCPVQQLVDLYHKHMPLNPQCRVMNDARRRTIAARWREASQLDCAPFKGGYVTQADGLKAWAAFFAICADSEFLTGRSPTKPGERPFVATLDFLVSPAGFAKTLENKYH